MEQAEGLEILDNRKTSHALHFGCLMHLLLNTVSTAGSNMPDDLTTNRGCSWHCVLKAELMICKL